LVTGVVVVVAKGIQYRPALAVHAVVAQVAELARPVHFRGQLSGTGGGIGLTAIDAGFLAAFDKAEHVTYQAPVVKRTQRGQQPTLFVTGRPVGRIESTFQTGSLVGQFRNDLAL
jgi:hypothetical protein